MALESPDTILYERISIASWRAHNAERILFRLLPNNIWARIHKKQLVWVNAHMILQFYIGLAYDPGRQESTFNIILKSSIKE